MITIPIDSLPQELVCKAVTEYLARNQKTKSVATKKPSTPVRTKLRSDSKVYQKIEELTKHYGSGAEVCRRLKFSPNTISYILSRRKVGASTINTLMNHKVVSK